jgi:hypothetical protein
MFIVDRQTSRKRTLSNQQQSESDVVMDESRRLLTVLSSNRLSTAHELATRLDDGGLFGQLQSY